MTARRKPRTRRKVVRPPEAPTRADVNKRGLSENGAARLTAEIRRDFVKGFQQRDPPMSDEDAEAEAARLVPDTLSADDVVRVLRKDVVVTLARLEEFTSEPESSKAGPMTLAGVGVHRGHRLGKTARTKQLIDDAQIDQPSQIALTAAPLLTHGFAAILDTAADLLGREPLAMERNLLSYVGQAVSIRVRRAILLHVLEAVEWNMAHAALQLQLGTSTHVMHYIRELGLEAAYQQAKTAGRIKVGGRRPRVLKADADSDPKRK